MLNRDQLLTVAVIVSVCGVTSLYLFTSQQPTMRVEPSEIDEGMLGSRVVTEGTISDVNWAGNTLLLGLKEEDHPGSLTVVVSKDTAEEVVEDVRGIKAGAEVEVEGILEEYEGDINLRVDDLGHISIMKKAQSSFVEISSLLETPGWYEGMNVKVKGDVVELKNTSQETALILSDLEGGGKYELTCVISDWEKEDPIGKPAVVKGEWVYENDRGRWVLRASGVPEIKSAE